MAKIKSKGTKLQMEIATVLTDIAQIISLELPEMESESYEADTLDNATAGIPYEPTGRTEPGSVSGELFFDPALAGHKALVALLSTPTKTDFSLEFADVATTAWPFTSAGFKLGGSIALNEGVKASFSVKLADLPTFPA